MASLLSKCSQIIPIPKSVVILLGIGNQTQYGFSNKEMAMPFLYLGLDVVVLRAARSNF
jgi:hypothetical protein